MDKKTEEKIEEKFGKELTKEIKKEVEEKVESEVKKRLTEKIYKGYKGTVSSALEFRSEFKSQIVVGITAAFAFLIALSWREPIQKSVDSLIIRLGLVGKEIYFQFLSAIIITLIAALVLVFLSKWKSDNKRE